MSGTRIIDTIMNVQAFAAAVPSSAVTPWVSLKGYDHIQFLIHYTNATGVTGAAITLEQATTVSGTNSKSLAFTTMFSALNSTTTFGAVQNVVTGNTFTIDGTASQSGFYVIEVDAITLDLEDGFDCINIVIGNATAQTVGVSYHMGVWPRYAGGFDSMMNPLNN
jgi:hypothetical protein